ncbi:MAG: serine/threonine-protein kinase [Steroidobacteraceae bacterium]
MTVAGDCDSTILRTSSDTQTGSANPLPNTGVSTGGSTPSTENDPLGDSGSCEEAREGMVLKGKYRLDQRVGEGGMGIVFRATDLDCLGLGTNEPVAVKVLKPEFRTRPDALLALNEEVRKGRVLASAHIVAAYSFNRDDHQIFMTMEFVEGKPLDMLLEEEFASGMRFERALPIIQDMVGALAEAHRHGIIHSDFKPSNVIVPAGGGAKVLDFGIARAVRGTRPGRYDAGKLGGLSVAYASLEMWDSNSQPDVRDDIYALGCVIYEMLAGRHPFGRKSAVEAHECEFEYRPIAALSRSQNRALNEALAFDRHKRTQTVEAILEGLKSGANADGKRTGWFIAAAMAVVLVALGAWVGMNRMGYKDTDDKIINSMIQPTARPRDDADPAMVKMLLDQGNDYLAQGKKQFDPSLLSEGVSTAVGAFRGVLQFDPANRQAAAGIAETFKLYRNEAKRYFDEKQYRKALEITDMGLKVYPDSEDLRELHEELAHRLYDSEASAPPKPGPLS